VDRFSVELDAIPDESSATGKLASLAPWNLRLATVARRGIKSQLGAELDAAYHEGKTEISHELVADQ
jgi:hypothetical protein